MVIQALLIGATALSTLGLVLYRDAALLSTALPGWLVVTVNLILAVLPFTAMMAALSATVKSARQATVWAILKPTAGLDPVMQCINSHHWQYRQLSHGKSLEEKLFFRD